MTCPIHLHRHPMMMVSMLSWLQRASNCWLKMVSGQKICRILLRFFVWKTDGLVMSLSIILQHSEPYSRAGITALVDLQLGLFAVLRWPTHIVEHSEGVSGLVERVLDVTPCSSYFPACVGEYGRSRLDHLQNLGPPTLRRGSIWCPVIDLLLCASLPSQWSCWRASPTLYSLVWRQSSLESWFRCCLLCMWICCRSFGWCR